MKKNKLNLAALIAYMAIFTFVSCVPLQLDSPNLEEEIPGEIETPGEVVVKKIPVSIVMQEYPSSYLSFMSLSFSYDEQNRLIEIKETNKDITPNTHDKKFEITQVIEYADKTNKPSKIATTFQGYIFDTDYVINFSYPDNLTVEYQEEYSNTNHPYASYLMELNDKEQLVKHYYYSDSHTYTTSYYYNEDGNMLKILVDDYTSHNTYTFDNKKGIFSDINAPYWLITKRLSFEGLGYLFMVNNPLTIRGDNASAIATYEYDSDGYPVKISFHNRKLYIDGVQEEEGERDEVFVITYKEVTPM